MGAQVNVAIDLNPHHLEEVLRILGIYVPEMEVRAFGSRVKWTAKTFSDLDLALMTKRPLSLEQEAQLREAFDESTLPFKVDFVDWASTSKNFQNIISAGSVVFRPAPKHLSGEKWAVMPLEEALDALLDYRGKTPEKTSFGIPLITAKIVKNGRIEPATEFIARENYAEWMTRGLPRAGDVLLTSEAPLGEVAQLHTDQVALAQRIMALRGKAGVLDNTYLCYLLQTEEMQEQLAARATGTTVLGIKQSELRKIAVRLPPLERQRAAAAVLSALDDRITLLRETNATLEAIAQALFKSWFVDFDPVRAKMEGRAPEGMDEATAALFPDGFEESELGEVPIGWRLGALSDLASLNAGSWTARNAPSEVTYVDLAGVKNNAFDVPQAIAFSDAPSRARRRLRPGDSIVGTVRPGNRSFGFIAHADNNLTGSTGFAVLSPKRKEVTAFVYLGATREENIDRLASLADGGAYPAVKPELVAATKCVLPSDEVMCEFEAVTRPLLDAISANSARAYSLAMLRDTLLPRLISGQLRLPEAAALAEEATR
jgi:type I restriction enzyme S subunit